MDDILRMLKRVKTSPDGLEFISYLESLSQSNYVAFKRDDTTMNDIHKGYAIAIDSILQGFKDCDIERQEDKQALGGWN